MGIYTCIYIPSSYIFTQHYIILTTNTCVGFFPLYSHDRLSFTNQVFSGQSSASTSKKFRTRVLGDTAGLYLERSTQYQLVDSFIVISLWLARKRDIYTSNIMNDVLWAIYGIRN